jgi:hypothetical protein
MENGKRLMNSKSVKYLHLENSKRKHQSEDIKVAKKAVGE